MIVVSARRELLSRRSNNQFSSRLHDGGRSTPRFDDFVSVARDQRMALLLMARLGVPICDRPCPDELV